MAASSLHLFVMLVAAAAHTGSCIKCYACDNIILKSNDEALNSALAQSNIVDAKCTQDREKFDTTPPKTGTCIGTSAVCTKIDAFFNFYVIGVGTVTVEMISRGCGDATWGEGHACYSATDYRDFFVGLLDRPVGDLSGYVCGCNDDDLCNSATRAIASAGLLLAALIVSNLF